MRHLPGSGFRRRGLTRSGGSGAGTALVRINCLVAAGQAEGREVRTVEGLTDGDTLDPVQQSFVDAGAVQCGFCTPGLVVAAHDLLNRVASPSDEEIREALAGNLCRCTGYEKILDAVRLAATVKGGAA